MAKVADCCKFNKKRIAIFDKKMRLHVAKVADFASLRFNKKWQILTKKLNIDISLKYILDFI
mgnify:CR=1 FL=1